MHNILSDALKKLTSYIAQIYIFFVFCTSKVRVRVSPESKELLEKSVALPCLWHNRILLIPSLMKRFGSFSAVISMHKDGDFLSEFLIRYGHSSVRGSSRKGSFNAMKGIVECLKNKKSVFITPDGPLGPRYNINGNITSISSKYNAPVIPVCYSARNSKILKTWDKFIIPLPFNNIILEISDPIVFDENSTEEFKKELLQKTMMIQSEKLDREVVSEKEAIFFVPRIMFLVYRLSSYIAHYFIRMYLNFRIQNGKETEVSIKEKLAFPSAERPSGKLLWVHAASVGESKSVMPIIDILSKKHKLNILITTSTLTGADFIKTKISSNKKLIHQFIVLDTPQNVKKFFNYWKPDGAVFIDSEIWPNVLYDAKFPVILANGRISPKSFYYWNMIPKAFNFVTRNITIISPTTKQDEDFFNILGVRDKIVNLGNLKNASPPLEYDSNEYNRLKKALAGFNFLCASTHADEEANILQYFKSSGLNIIIAPRHPNRGKEIAEYGEKIGFEVLMRSDASVPKFTSKKPKLYIIDKLGELGLWYKLADIAFIGGSFVQVGGHNVIEAAQLGCPVIVGPQIYNFSDAVSHLKKYNAIMQVNTFDELKEVVLSVDKARLKELSENALNSSSSNTEIIANHVNCILDVMNKV